jgi:F-type H+-transporting ATPase subunit b
MDIEFPQILFQILNFSLILFVLNKFLYKPIMKVLAERTDRIDQGLLAAKASLEEKDQIDSLKKAEMHKAQLESQKIIDEAKSEAEKIAKGIVEKAKLDAQAVTQKEAVAFKSKMADEEQQLAKRISDLIILTTKSVLKDTLKTEYQQEIINEEIKLISKMSVN